MSSHWLIAPEISSPCMTCRGRCRGRWQVSLALFGFLWSHWIVKSAQTRAIYLWWYSIVIIRNLLEPGIEHCKGKYIIVKHPFCCLISCSLISWVRMHLLDRHNVRSIFSFWDLNVYSVFVFLSGSGESIRLMHLCRLTIRRVIGTQRLRRIAELKDYPLPNILVDYITLCRSK